MGKVFFEYIYNISFKLRNFPKFNKRPISLKTFIEWVTTDEEIIRDLSQSTFQFCLLPFGYFGHLLTLVRNWMDCKILISECFLTFISRLTAQEGGRLNNREGRFFISFCEHLVFYSAAQKVLLCYVELHRTFCEHRALYSAPWKALQKRTSSAVRKRTLSALRKREERVSKA